MSSQSELHGKHIVLGLSGGIACFKSAELVRELVRHGATVQVVMTEAASMFITEVTMQALSNRSVYTSQWDQREPNAMAHINLTRRADAVLVAPASADFMAKLAQGRADDLLSLLCLARPIERCPLLLAPAMNREMWAHPATQRNLAQIVADGAVVLGPGHGDQACGETGDGRMLEAEELRDITLVGHSAGGKSWPMPAIGKSVASGIIRTMSRAARSGNSGSRLPWMTSVGTRVSRSPGRRSGVARTAANWRR